MKKEEKRGEKGRRQGEWMKEIQSSISAHFSNDEIEGGLETKREERKQGE